jgi:sec-independent protein translocase protein TatA
MTFLASPFNLAGGDGLIIFIIILLLFGAKKLPELARGLGSAVREFSKAKDEIEHEITRASEQPKQIQPPRDTQPQIARTDDQYHQDPYHNDPYHQEPQGQPAHTTEPAPGTTASSTGTTGPAGPGPSTPV